MPDVYYPALSDLMTVDDLPEILSFIKGAIDQTFDNTYYKDIQISKSIEGSGAFYSLSVVSRQKIQIEIPGTGIYLVLNPDYTDDTISSFPITVFWEWDILKYLNDFNFSTFSFLVQDLFNLGLDVFNVIDESTLKVAAYAFAAPSDPSATYIVNIDPSIATQNLNAFFSTFERSDLKDYITNLAIPKARATLELTAALEFPRNILLPMIHNPDGSYSPDNSTDSSGNLKSVYTICGCYFRPGYQYRFWLPNRFFGYSISNLCPNS